MRGVRAFILTAFSRLRLLVFALALYSSFKRDPVENLGSARGRFRLFPRPLFSIGFGCRCPSRRVIFIFMLLLVVILMFSTSG